MAETTGTDDGFYTCERCGKVKAVAPTSTCGCGGHGGDGGEAGHGGDGPTVPEGWDPELTRGSRPRLSIVRRPDPDE